MSLLHITQQGEDPIMERLDKRILRRLLRKFLKLGYVWFLLLLFAPGIAHAQVIGKASWYSTEACRYNPDPKCPTASGESLYKLEKEKNDFAASYSFPLRTVVRVTNVKNSKSVVVTILDRGPNKRLGRTIDLGLEAFKKIADPRQGIIQVTVEKI